MNFDIEHIYTMIILYTWPIILAISIYSYTVKIFKNPDIKGSDKFEVFSHTVGWGFCYPIIAYLAIGIILIVLIAGLILLPIWGIHKMMLYYLKNKYHLGNDS